MTKNVAWIMVPTIAPTKPPTKPPEKLLSVSTVEYVHLYYYK